MAALDIVKHFVTEQNEFFRDNLQKLIPQCVKLTINPDSMVWISNFIHTSVLMNFIISALFLFTERSVDGYNCFGDHRKLSSICCSTIRSRCSVWFAGSTGWSQAIGAKCRCSSTQQMVFGRNRSIKIQMHKGNENGRIDFLCYYCYFVDNKYTRFFFYVFKCHTYRNLNTVYTL